MKVTVSPGLGLPLEFVTVHVPVDVDLPPARMLEGVTITPIIGPVWVRVACANSVPPITGHFAVIVA